jgi:hypothetical protein
LFGGLQGRKIDVHGDNVKGEKSQKAVKAVGAFPKVKARGTKKEQGSEKPKCGIIKISEDMDKSIKGTTLRGDKTGKRARFADQVLGYHGTLRREFD